jgi:hypothetical protein
MFIQDFQSPRCKTKEGGVLVSRHARGWGTPIGGVARAALKRLLWIALASIRAELRQPQEAK